MNIGIISSCACAHQYAAWFDKNDKIYHFGAHSTILENNNYIPFHYNFIPYESPDIFLKAAEKDIKKAKLDFVVTSGLELATSEFSHTFFRNIEIDYFFPSKKLTGLENDKWACKKILKKIGLPVKDGLEVDGVYLKDNFDVIARPYVIKFKRYMHGRQTIVVTDENYETIMKELFDINHYMYIHDSDTMVIEDYLEITKEYSYHCIVNKVNWQYIGSARDYKKSENGDLGFNCVSMGAYNITEINPIVHTFVDRIINHLKAHSYFYKGFLFLQIAEDKHGDPYILEINTRNGDPEISSILPSIENNISELLFCASKDLKIPEVKFNNKKTVTVRLVNNDYNWTKIPTNLPSFSKIPKHLIVGLEGSSPIKLKHSLITSSEETYETASKKIYKFLDKQYLGQFRYRTDIGIFK